MDIQRMNALPQQAVAKPKNRPTLYAELASTEADVRESQALRYRIFCEELGAQLHSPLAGYDIDHFDPYCHHLLVRRADSGEVVASTRLLSGAMAREAGGFYSDSEFDLTNIKALRGRVLEIGRTCVAPAYRSGAGISVLWSGLADYVSLHSFDYLCGCASIDLRDGGIRAAIITDKLRQQALADESLRVTPRKAVPYPDYDNKLAAPLPPLLKAYIRLGAKVCGDACWDPDFQVADLFVLVKLDELDASYARHFLGSRRVPPR